MVGSTLENMVVLFALRGYRVGEANLSRKEVILLVAIPDRIVYFIRLPPSTHSSHHTFFHYAPLSIHHLYKVAYPHYHHLSTIITSMIIASLLMTHHHWRNDALLASPLSFNDHFIKRKGNDQMMILYMMSQRSTHLKTIILEIVHTNV